MVEEVEMVGEKENERRPKYPRIVSVEKEDVKFRFLECANRETGEIHVVKRMLVEERRVRGRPLGLKPLDRLMLFEPYYLEDKITGSQGAIEVFLEFVNWKRRVDALPPIYVPANWDDGKVLRFVHRIWELGRWMEKPELSMNAPVYPKIIDMKELDAKLALERCKGFPHEPFEIRIARRIVVKVKRGSRNSSWRNGSWVKPLKRLMFYEPYFFKGIIDGAEGATQVIVELDWYASQEEELVPLYVPAEWGYKPVPEFVRRLVNLSKWIASA